MKVNLSRREYVLTIWNRKGEMVENWTYGAGFDQVSSPFQIAVRSGHGDTETSNPVIADRIPPSLPNRITRRCFLMIVPAIVWRSLAVAATCASLFTGCSRQHESTEPTSPPVKAAAETTEGSPASAVVTGRVPLMRGGLMSVVMLTSADTRELPSQTATPVMDQAQKTFIPEVLFVRTGQPTEIRNSDSEFHNVHVREEATKEGTFNIGIAPGATYRHTFERDGFYDVGCDIHPAMSAMIIAASTPYTAVADSGGSFTIYGVAPGSYVATVYAGGDAFQRIVQVAVGRTDINLTDLVAILKS